MFHSMMDSIQKEWTPCHNRAAKSFRPLSTSKSFKKGGMRLHCDMESTFITVKQTLVWNELNLNSKWKDQDLVSSADLFKQVRSKEKIALTMLISKRKQQAILLKMYFSFKM